MNNQDLNNLKNQVNKRVLELHLKGFNHEETLAKYHIGNGLYQAKNCFEERVIEQACSRLGLSYTRLGKNFLIK